MTNHEHDYGRPGDNRVIPLCRSIPYSEVEVFRLEAECGVKVEEFVRKRLRGDPDTIKVVERCWVDLVRKWKHQGELVHPRALLFRLAHLRCTDRLRQLARRPETSLEDRRLLDEAANALVGTSEFVSALVVRLDVRAALGKLPIRQRQALLFTYGYGLEYQDTAALMACSVDAVGNLLRAGKTTMRKSHHLSGYKAPEVRK